MLGEESDWIAKSDSVDGAAAEVVFLIKSDFFFGRDDRFMQEQHRIERLQPPNIPGFDGRRVDSTSVVGHETELAGHYKRVVQLAAKHAKPLRSAQTHFWLKLELRWQGGDVMFFWTDWWDEMQRFIGWAASAGEGDDWHDIDQGWELRVVRRGNAFHVHAGDAGDEVWANVALERDQLLASMQSLEKRMVHVLTCLEAAVGENYWVSSRWSR